MSDRMQKQAMEKFFNYMRAYSYPYKNYEGMSSVYPQEMAVQGFNKDADKQRKSQMSQYMSYNYPLYNPYSMGYPPRSFSMEAGAQAARLQAQTKNKTEVSYPPTNPYSPYYPYYYPYGMYSSYYSNHRGQTFTQKKDQHKQTEQKHHANFDAASFKILPKPAPPLIKQQIVISSDSEQVPVEKPIVNHQKQNQLISKSNFPEKDSKPISQKKLGNMEVIIEEQVDDAFYIRKKLKSQREAEKAQRLQKQKRQKLEKQKQKALKSKTEKLEKEKTFKYQRSFKPVQKNIVEKEEKHVQNDQAQDKFDKLPKTKPISKVNTKQSTYLIQKYRYNSLPNEAYIQMLKKQSRQQIQLFHQRQKQRQLQLAPDKQKFLQKQYKNSYLQPKRNPRIITQQPEKDWLKKQQNLKKEEKQLQMKKQQKEIKKDQKKPVTPVIPSPLQQKQIKKQRIRDDHPLKQLRYNQSHGRIRLGIYFQSNIPNLMRNEDLYMRRLELQKRLRERQVSAVTF